MSRSYGEDSGKSPADVVGESTSSNTSEKISMPFYVYILQCADTTLYVGSTNDISRRLNQHNTSKSGAHYTKIRRPVVLKYQEVFATLKEARKRESELKNWTRKEKLALFK